MNLMDLLINCFINLSKRTVTRELLVSIGLNNRLFNTYIYTYFFLSAGKGYQSDRVCSGNVVLRVSIIIFLINIFPHF